MADAILMSGGVGGVTSDDVTAKREHVLQGYTALTADSDDEVVQGTIPVRGYKGPDSSEFGYYPAEGGYVTRIEEGYYHKGGSYKPYVIAPTAKVKQAVNYHPEKTLSDTTTCGEQGQIPIWAPSGGDVIMANNSHSGQGFAYDLPGVGRGIVVGIKNGAFIQGANYVFFPMQNLLPHNLRAGENFAGITGTMPDYSSGRTVFNGATFDGLLVSGVATKGFYTNGVYYAYNIQSEYGYGGVYGGGMNLQLNTTYTALRSRRIGCVLSQSINVTPFRQIVIYYRSVANIQGNPYVSLEAHVSRASVRGQVNVSGTIVDTIDVVRQGTASPAINREGQIVLDVSAINEHIFLSFGALCNQDRASDIFAGAVQITRVDFLN